jgi:hypothetical protein
LLLKLICNLLNAKFISNIFNATENWYFKIVHQLIDKSTSFNNYYCTFKMPFSKLIDFACLKSNTLWTKPTNQTFKS